ncbi:MAG TPA: hypothetical protein DCE23_06995 [Firmicutes bacterium]|nr:hypothetical protein [Bacillota bacterium]
MEKEELYKGIIDYVENTDGFIKYNNMHIEELKDNYAKMYVDITKDSLNPSNIAHGGLIFGLADSVMGMAARTNNHNVVTINSSIEYLKPGKGSRLTAETEVLKVGKTTAVYRANIYTDKNVLCAIATATYFFID